MRTSSGKRRRQRRRRGRSQACPTAAALKRLALFFHANGYVRWQDERRLSEDGWQLYKKGDEIRLVASSKEELKLIRRLLRQAGFKTCRPFTKGRQFRQPLYGKRQVARFLDLIEA